MPLLKKMNSRKRTQRAHKYLSRNGQETRDDRRAVNILKDWFIHYQSTSKMPSWGFRLLRHAARRIRLLQILRDRWRSRGNTVRLSGLILGMVEWFCTHDSVKKKRDKIMGNRMIAKALSLRIEKAERTRRSFQIFEYKWFCYKEML